MRLALVSCISALVGCLVGAGIVIVLDSDDEAEAGRGRIVRLDPNERYDGTDDDPLCSPINRLCVTRDEEGEYVALYMVDPYEPARQQGCTVYWDPDDTLADEVLPGSSKGAFRSACSGNRWFVTGERLFGPAGRDLDQFSLSMDGDWFVIDTRNLICGTAWEENEATTCPRAPEQE